MKVIVVLPCYNEAQNLPNLVPRIPEALGSRRSLIVAVNDGSNDSTAEILHSLSKSFEILIVDHAVNMGLGAALRDGIRAAAHESEPDDAIVTMDADCTHDPDLIPNMLGILEDGFDVVVASRYALGGGQVGVPWNRVALSRLVNLIFGAAIGTSVKEVTGGYRCFKAAVITRLVNSYGEPFLAGQGFEVSIEILAKLKFLGAAFAEMPFCLNYALKRGKSKLRFLPSMRSYSQLLARLVSRRIRPPQTMSHASPGQPNRSLL